METCRQCGGLKPEPVMERCATCAQKVPAGDAGLGHHVRCAASHRFREFRAAITDVDLRRLLERALRNVEPNLVGVRAVTDSVQVVYDVVAEFSSIQTFARGFTVDDDRRVTLSSDRVEVIEQTEYVAALRAAAADPVWTRPNSWGLSRGTPHNPETLNGVPDSWGIAGAAR